MFDILPFPNITGETPAEQLEQMNSYLIQLKDTLEFILTSISADNLSADLRKQLESLGADIETNKTESEAVTEQIINRALTVDDVIRSSAFENAIPSFADASDGIAISTGDKRQTLQITVDYETGCLNYKV